MEFAECFFWAFGGIFLAKSTVLKIAFGGVRLSFDRLGSYRRSFATLVLFIRKNLSQKSTRQKPKKNIPQTL